MSEYKSEFLKTLDTRGFIKQMTHPAELDAYCASGVPVAYIGFDATADSLHVGSLLQIMMLRHFQQAGGKPVVLMGGGTTKVGDPTDKEKSRPLLTDDQIAANMAGIKKAFDPFLTFGDGPTDAIMVNNDDWLSKIGYVEFLRDYGVHFTINTMIKQETVDRRLRNEQPYTFLEFNYMLLQAYDFLELYRRYGVRLQLGGSDQWGNIVNGVDLTRRVAGGEAYGLTSHLITTSSGGKMGKTADGAVWLNAEKKSPYEYWQFWRNTEDGDVGRFLRLFTELHLDEIQALEALEGAEINEAKIALANAATSLLHGEEEAARSAAAAAAVFEQGATADALPTVDIARTDLESGMLAAAAFAAAGLAASNGEARRLIKQGAARVNDSALSDPNATLGVTDIIDGSIKLSAGKKRHALLKVL
ncbi:tyrosine--tRNA ligase [Hyphomonas johnsonii]|uniref:Tyrosine--tRNA ligase n=1 Tax=Hyphomonas johnsonii MHS-2 TaxID=1280950 RepID=A0A059FV23_9PROT|nr:tyrosine--tRNA ligase [Hyphomonas johnsonii]KCZ94515.1 tyrosyl-tRNA synthetase [Hyphomonas johnsonii MHS-2]